MKKIIKETPDYFIMVGIEAEGERSCYQVINKVYDVIEVETTLLPQAYEYLDQLQAATDARRDEEKALKETAKENSVIHFNS